MKALGWVTAFVGLMVFNSILSGYALSVLWAWFIVKTFGVPALTIPSAIGLAITVSYLTHQIDSDSKNEGAGLMLAKGLIIGIAKPAIALATGWVVVQFV